MKMRAGFSILALLMTGCATTTSDWAVLDTSQSDRVELVSQSGVLEVLGNDAKAQQTALRTCESKGYARAVELGTRAMTCSSGGNTQCDGQRRVVTFECQPAMDDHPVAFNGTLKK